MPREENRQAVNHQTLTHINIALSEADDVVFIFTGEGGQVIPRNASRVRVDASVISIPDIAFYKYKMLSEVELCDGVVEIGNE